ncbi:hypothetical protein LCGC14_2021800 [marine sediment metagenome]|uniref:Uncharacterized protein n=1 Tax=marine sediment metagenome TaxID=412755 RepID=A0A0F9HUF8_9ZZZZ
MDKTFDVWREDNCIWIADLRIPIGPEVERSASLKHLVPEQARELIEALQEVLKR